MTGAASTAAGNTLDLAGKEFKTLHRLEINEGATGLGGPGAPHVGIVVDVETTGLDRKEDVIVELAMRRFRYDDAGRITEIGRPYCWLEDPGRPLSEDIAKLTGLDDAMLAGQSIDENAATRLLRSATLVCAHNAAFDRGRVEDRLPGAAGLAWACTFAEIDWRGAGFDGRGLGYLLAQAGFYNGAHRASADVDSTIALLAREVAPGRTALAELVERSFQDSWIVRAVGAAFERKDDLKARGYRWDHETKLWSREVADKMKEEWWLAGNIYSAEANPKALGPQWEAITNRERWR